MSSFTSRPLLLGSAAALCGCAGADVQIPARVTGPLPHGAYVWQRAWTEPVREAAENAHFDSLAPLAYEVEWRGQEPRITAVDVPIESRVQAIRVEVPPEGVDGVAALRPLIRQACGRGAVHLDMDMPSRRLGEYAEWLQVFSRECDVRVTALPTWIGEPGFEEVAEHGFVLQVHWFDPSDPLGPLLDERAAEVVEDAAAYGLPFEVALPAYGHRVWLRHGVPVQLDSEGEIRAPAGATARTVMADPVAVSRLLEGWRGSHPQNLRRVWWFRLPTAQDELAWSPVTLDAVRAGLPLHDDLVVRQTASRADGSQPVCLHNRGTLPWLGEPIPVESPIAGGDNGWTYSPSRGALVPPRVFHPLQPGATRCVGWTRPSVRR